MDEVREAYIQNLKTLEFLYLKGNEITDISPIFELKNLVEIEITSNPITNEQLVTLQNKLPDTRIIFR